MYVVKTKAAAFLRLIVLTLCLLRGASVVGQMGPQNGQQSRLKAVFIYNFSRYFEWPNQAQLTEFRIGIISKEAGLKEYLNEIATKKKVGNLPIRIIELSSDKNLPELEMLYVDFDLYPDYKLDPKLKNTLVLSYACADLKNSMIAFMDIENKLKFAVNLINVSKSGLKMNPDFESLAYAVVRDKNDYAKNTVETKKWKSVFDKLNASVQNQKKEVTLSKEELEQIVDKYSEQNTAISEQKQSIEKQMKDLALQLKEIETQKQNINEQNQQIAKQSAEITEQEDKLKLVSTDLKKTSFENSLQQNELARKKRELAAQQSRSREQAEILDLQKKDIAAQSEKLILQLNQINTQKIILWLVLAIFLVIVFFVCMLLKSFRKIRKVNAVLEVQKQEISEQKHLVEEKHKEITDSINYAERIQRSFLASKDLLDEHLKQYFVFFQPKDVVSGDFYWAGKTAAGNFVLVTADSTGHGVPGAIMSILNISSLEKAIHAGVSEAAEILNHTRSNIIERLKKDGSAEGGKDGMDCSLLCLDLNAKKMTYAAAHNPVWIIRERQLIELAPDNMPVGKHDRDSQSFTQSSLELREGDVVYTLTDGYPDQFGGLKGKKFMYKKLKELLLSISNLSMEEQKQMLSQTLSDWKGNLEQVDDICVLGFRV